MGAGKDNSRGIDNATAAKPNEDLTYEMGDSERPPYDVGAV